MRSRRIRRLQALVHGANQCLNPIDAIPARPSVGACISTSTLPESGPLRPCLKVNCKGRRIGVAEIYGTPAFDAATVPKVRIRAEFGTPDFEKRLMQRLPRRSRFVATRAITSTRRSSAMSPDHLRSTPPKPGTLRRLRAKRPDLSARYEGDHWMTSCCQPKRTRQEPAPGTEW